jgi:DNA replication protein DnaC
MMNLETLLRELGFKTPLSEIQPQIHDTIAQFLKTEQDYRTQYKIQRLLRLSGIKQVKTLKQFDWNFNHKIPKKDILSFSNSDWIENAFNLVLIGDSGLGKSHIASTLCYEAILKGFPTTFITAFDLTSKIHKALNISAKLRSITMLK